MGRIASDVGLISGINITDTVDKLIELQSQPKVRLEARQQDVKDRQKALGELTALTIGVQLAIRKLNDVDAFSKRATTSSNDAVLTATATKAVPLGSYSIQSVRTAQAHQVVSSGFTSRTATVGAGTFSVGFGGTVNPGAALADLNSGAGVRRGLISITDRSGATAQIDLRAASTVDDVLDAINGATGIRVRAEVDGDSLRLVDLTGSTANNLRVDEVGGGSTAADLGLANINVAAASATGSDIQQLFSGLQLSSLNDGNGVSIRPSVPDLEISFRDNSSPLSISFEDETTLGELVATINAADPTRLQATIDGDHLKLTDLTTDAGGTFSVSSTAGGTTAHDLGLEGTASGDTLVSDRLLSGLKSTLLRSLNGGQGLGTLGSLSITNRNGGSTSVDLSSASTLDDVIDAINNSGAGVVASYNATRSGLQIVDASGGTGSLIIANDDATNTATKLQLEANAAVASVDSGSLHRQSVSEGTLLSSLNGGTGVNLSTILIQNANGVTKALQLGTLQPKTIGDVIDAINALGNGVTAQINDTGDGISLTDTTGGSGSLAVVDYGSGTSAAQLHIAGTSNSGTISGSTAFSITTSSTDTLEDLVTKINNLNGPFTATIVSDGTGSLPDHLQLISKVSGKIGELQIQTDIAGLTFSDVSKAQDAAALVGATATSAGRLVTSSTNKLVGVVDGLDVTLHDTSTSNVTLNVTQNVDSISSAVQLFVDQYNKLRDKLDELDYYNVDDDTKGLFFGSSETLRLNSDVTRQLTGRFFGAGRFQSLAQFGITIDDNGKLEYTSSTLKEQFNSADGDDAIKFFTDPDNGFSKKLDNTLETIVGSKNSLFVNRLAVLSAQSEQNTERINFLQDRLDVSRENLLNQFYRMELAISKIQESQSSITTLTNLASSLNG